MVEIQGPKHLEDVHFLQIYLGALLSLQKYDHHHSIIKHLIKIYIKEKKFGDVLKIYENMERRYVLQKSLHLDQVQFCDCLQNGNYIILTTEKVVRIIDGDGKILSTFETSGVPKFVLETAEGSICIAERYILYILDQNLKLLVKFNDLGPITSITELIQEKLLVIVQNKQTIRFISKDSLKTKDMDPCLGDGVNSIVPYTYGNFSMIGTCSWYVYFWKKTKVLDVKRFSAQEMIIAVSSTIDQRIVALTEHSLFIFRNEKGEIFLKHDFPSNQTKLPFLKCLKNGSFATIALDHHKQEFYLTISIIFEDSKKSPSLGTVFEVKLPHAPTCLFETFQGSLGICLANEIVFYQPIIDKEDLVAITRICEQERSAKLGTYASMLAFKYFDVREYDKIVAFCHLKNLDPILDDLIAQSKEISKEMPQAAQHYYCAAKGYFWGFQYLNAICCIKKASSCDPKIESIDFCQLKLKVLESMYLKDEILEMKRQLMHLYWKDKKFLQATDMADYANEEDLLLVIDCFQNLKDNISLSKWAIHLAYKYLDAKKYKQVEDLFEEHNLKGPQEISLLAQAKEKLGSLSLAAQLYISSGIAFFKMKNYVYAESNFKSAFSIDATTELNAEIISQYLMCLDSNRQLTREIIENQKIELAFYPLEKEKFDIVALIYETLPKTKQNQTFLMDMYFKCREVKKLNAVIVDLCENETDDEKKLELISKSLVKNIPVWEREASAYISKFKHEEAANCLLQVSKEYQSLGDYGNALNALKRARDLSSKNIEVMDALVSIYALREDLITASMLCVQIANISEEHKDFVTSEKYYRKALELDPQAFSITKHNQGGIYTVQKSVATGGQGSVYLCKNTALGSKREIQCAVKIIDCGGSIEDSNKAMGELLNIQKISHPNIIEILDMYLEITNSDTCTISLVMYYYPLGDLEHFLKSKKLIKSQMLDYSKQIATGIMHLHKHKIAHRDIKPQNILVEHTKGKAVLKLIDFGYASTLSEFGMSKTVVGTAGWIAHEVESGKQYDARKADMFSFGLLLYYLITGTKQPPVALLTDRSATLKNMEEMIRENFSQRMVDLVFRLVSLDPQKRPTAEEVIKVIDLELDSDISPVIEKRGIFLQAPVEIHVKALLSFQGQSENELSFEKGESLVIILNSDNGWCCGKKNGRIGIFPRKFVSEQL